MTAQTEDEQTGKVLVEVKVLTHCAGECVRAGVGSGQESIHTAVHEQASRGRDSTDSLQRRRHFYLSLLA